MLGNKKIGLEILHNISQLFQYKTIVDSKGNEYVLLANSAVIDVEAVTDKTAFEASDSHVHLWDNITQKELPDLINISKSLGAAMLACLSYRFPDKKFRVYATLSLHDSMILRFHQVWPDELPYYEPSGFISTDERIFLFET